MSFASSCAIWYSGLIPTYGAGAAMTLRLMSPHAPRVLPMFLITAWNVAFRSVFKMPWSWYVWRVVRRSVPLPWESARSSMMR